MSGGTATVNRRTSNAVTLTHEDAQIAEKLLSDYARELWRQQQRSKSAAVRAYCQQQAEQADRLSHLIVGGLWTWEMEQAVRS